MVGGNAGQLGFVADRLSTDSIIDCRNALELDLEEKGVKVVGLLPVGQLAFTLPAVGRVNLGLLLAGGVDTSSGRVPSLSQLISAAALARACSSDSPTPSVAANTLSRPIRSSVPVLLSWSRTREPTPDSSR